MYSIDIREFRRANKMTQQELADYFGVVQGFISNMENGREKVPDKYISKILGDPNVDSSMVKAVAPENEVKMPREVFDKFSLLLETISSQQGTIADQQKVNAEQGRLIAQIYYDKPVIQGDSEAVKKINAYFDNEANAFYNQGTSVTWFSADAFQQFKDGLELMKERWGNEMMAEYPTRYAMDTSVCYMDENIISIVQVRNYMLEHNSWHCYGSTFDLRTGELIPITKLISIKPEEMKAIFLITGNIIDIGVYEVLKDDNYVIDFGGHRIDMKYEYFYDGESYYLINEFALEFRTSSVLKWNGKWGENLEVTELYYYTDRTTGQIACRESGMS